ncbi:tRNA (adenosine(37)-N6)-threonylcarbamoyltransferase complex ATPase subunit type 1 TsaE [Bacillus sp. SL00103]
MTLEGFRRRQNDFFKRFCRSLGITRIVNSPTFTIIKEYTDGRLPLYHMDVYRMEDAEEDIGLEEYFEGEVYAWLVGTSHWTSITFLLFKNRNAKNRT